MPYLLYTEWCAGGDTIGQCSVTPEPPALPGPARHQEASCPRRHLHCAALSLWTTGSHQMGRCGETRGHSVQLTRQPIIQAGTLFITSLLNRAKTVCGLGAPLSEISTIFGLQQTLLNINDEIIDIKLIYYYLNKIFIGRHVFFQFRHLFLQQ